MEEYQDVVEYFMLRQGYNAEQRKECIAILKLLANPDIRSVVLEYSKK